MNCTIQAPPIGCIPRKPAFQWICLNIMDARQERELFEKWDVTKAVFYLAFPTVAGQIILVIYNMADTFFVGLAGNDATIAAVTVCMPAFMFLSAISNLFGIGGASVISRARGAKESEQVRLTAEVAGVGTQTSRT